MTACTCGRTLAAARGDLAETCPDCGSLPAFCDCTELPRRKLILTPASEIEPEPVTWAWEDAGQGRIPAGSFGLAAGREGTGKSCFGIWLSAQVTRGTLPGSMHGTQGSVIYVAVEDVWRFTISPRLIAAGAERSRMYRAEAQNIDGEIVSLSLPADNRLLEEEITGRGVRLVVFDPLMSAISETLDTHVNRQVRRALDPLARMADKTGAAILGIAHFSKGPSTDASSLITGSGAFKDVARYIFAFAAGEDGDGGARVITQTKNSLGRSDLPSLQYRVIEAIVPTPKGNAKTGKFVLDGETDLSVSDILESSGGSPDKLRAEDFLRKALAGGPRLTREVEEEAREAHSISKRTLDRARAALRIPAAKHGEAWWVSLPEHEGDLRAKDPEPAAKDANNANTVTRGDVGTVGSLPRPETLWGDGETTGNPNPPTAEVKHCERPGCPHRDSRPESCPGYSWKVHHDSHHKTKDKKWCCQVCCNWAARRSGGAQ